MSFSFRLATEQDFGQIHALNLQFSHFIKTPEKFRISIDEMIAEKEFFDVVVAEKDDGKIVGFASTFIAWYSWIGKSMYLDDLFVSEAYRRNGLGGKLLKAVIELAKEKDCKKLRWQVSKWNENAIGFYKKIGAEIDSTEINCDLIF